MRRFKDIAIGALLAALIFTNTAGLRQTRNPDPEVRSRREKLLTLNQMIVADTGYTLKQILQPGTVDTVFGNLTAAQRKYLKVQAQINVFLLRQFGADSE